MTMVHELGPGRQIEGPGIYVQAAEFTWGLKPERGGDGHERVPFAWATEWPPLHEFIRHFPQYWTANAKAEFWRGGPFKPNGIYWCKYDPRQVLKAGGS